MPIQFHIIGFPNDQTISTIQYLLKSLTEQTEQTILKPVILDPREPPKPCDILIHLGIPIFSSIPWAHVNILWMNDTVWCDGYDDSIHGMDAVIFSDPITCDLFRMRWENKELNPLCIVITPFLQHEFQYTPFSSRSSEFLTIVDSEHSYQTIKTLLPYWLSSDPKLTIYASDLFIAGLQECGNHTIIELKDKEKLMTQSKGYIGSNLTIYEYMRLEEMGTYTFCTDKSHNRGIKLHLTNHEEIRSVLEKGFSEYTDESLAMDRQKVCRKRSSIAISECNTAFPGIYELLYQRKPKRGVIHLPPILEIKDCPPISIITPTFHRKHLIPIVFHSLLSTDYPKDKIEWIVVEDHEKRSMMATEEIVNFQLQCPIQIKYIPIEGRMSIGQKRNIGIEQASHDIILFMDDDDHYPITSIRRRVAWLTKGTKMGQLASIVCCTTLPLYDLQRGISAVSVPPYSLPLKQRVSEATLTFRKSAWLDRKFPEVSVSEGEEWIAGRERDVLEIPPQQIIVALSHGANQASRKIPDQPPSCFWGFPKEFLVFLHSLVGVKV